LTVESVERSIAFYRDKLGLPVEWNAAPAFAMLRVGGAGGRDQKAKGVVFHAPPHDEPWERSMTALDPDGYAVEFAQGKRGHNKPAG
jgi:catechol 2,3-dioxygenase-like lactoylglutathione lyase family enzyme